MGAAISYKYSNTYPLTRSYRKMSIRWVEKTGVLSGVYTYLDDATEMPDGLSLSATESWQEFFGYRPCLFKNGQVVGYLNPNDFSKFEDGSSADITSGNAGDVMIEFPRRGIKITRVDASDHNNTITVSMTDNPADPDYTYYAHTRGSRDVDYFYISAYLASDLKSSSGTTGKGQLYSVCIDPSNTSANRLWYGNHGELSGLNESVSAKTLLANKGDGYDLLTFHQITFLQVMYLLQFKNPNPHNRVVGVGSGWYDAPYTPDGSTTWPSFNYTTTKGMICSSQSTSTPVKLFGLDNLWSSTFTIFTGLAVHIEETTLSYLGEYHTDYYTATDNFYYEPVPFGSLDVTNIGYTKVGSFERPIDDIFNSKYDVLVDNPTKIWYFSGNDALGFFAVAKGRFTNNDGDSIYFAKSGPVGLLLGGPDDELYDGVLCRFGSTDSSSGGLFATQVVGKERSTTTFEQGAGVVRFCYF